MLFRSTFLKSHSRRRTSAQSLDHKSRDNLSNTYTWFLAVVLGVVLGFGLDYAVLAQTLKESPSAICVYGDYQSGAACPYATDKKATRAAIFVPTDTRGVDFGPYLFIVLQTVRKSGIP